MFPTIFVISANNSDSVRFENSFFEESTELLKIFFRETLSYKSLHVSE